MDTLIRMDIESQIKHKGTELGFDAVGITTAEPLDPTYAAYHDKWLTAGCAARMGYLHRNNDKRFAPARLLDGAQSVICVALSYRPRPDEVADDAWPAIGRYALYDDYHGFIKTRLHQLAAFIQSLRPDTPSRFKACVDAIPLAERALARRAGLGRIGRNHCLIHPVLGGQIFLGELLTTLELKSDRPLDGSVCETCRACVKACPTGALEPDGNFDARKCLSYLTIEEHGPIEAAPGEHLAAPLFGCDVCLTVCPHTRNAPSRHNTDLVFHRERIALTAEQVLGWSQAEFDAMFKGSCLERLGLLRLQRNARLFRKSTEGK